MTLTITTRNDPRTSKATLSLKRARTSYRSLQHNRMSNTNPNAPGAQTKDNLPYEERETYKECKDPAIILFHVVVLRATRAEYSLTAQRLQLHLTPLLVPYYSYIYPNLMLSLCQVLKNIQEFF